MIICETFNATPEWKCNCFFAEKSLYMGVASSILEAEASKDVAVHDLNSIDEVKTEIGRLRALIKVGAAASQMYKVLKTVYVH